MKRQHKAFSSSLLIYVLVGLLIALLCRLLYGWMLRAEEARASAAPAVARKGLLLDPGHGGFDGGALSVTGSKEKEINLSVSLRLREICSLLGYDVVMTRDSDTALSVTGSTESHKMQDLSGRLSVAKEYPDYPFISIHMNKFSESRYHGLQVFYSANHPTGTKMAQSVQDTVARYLQPDNKREIKAAGSNIFILDRIRTPAILIECGFLSNPEEAALLEDPLYQTKLCLLIAEATTGVLP